MRVLMFLVNVFVGVLGFVAVIRFGRNHVDFESGNSAARHAAHLQPRAHAKRCGRLLEKSERYTRIDERAEHHVAAYTGKTLEIGCAHRTRILSSRRSFRKTERRVT